MAEADETGPDDAAVTDLLRHAGRPPRDVIARRMREVVNAGLFGDPAEPTRIDRYIVLERVASGAMGTVVAAYDPQLDRKVALKLLQTRGDEAWRGRLMREAKALARLSHPNVVAVHDAGSHDDEVFLAMELVEGVDVARWLDAMPRAWSEVLDVFVQAGHGLAAAHAAGLVHRDVKPANILVGDDGRVRVADFGLSRTRAEADAEPSSPESASEDPGLHSVTRSGARVGTPAYMAPEQHVGEAATERSDQFQFCVGLWESLFARRPFSGTDEQALLEAKRRGPDPPPDGHDVPEQVVAAIRRGLAADPSARHSDMDALVAAITVDPLRVRRRAAWIVASVGGIALVAGIGLSWHRPAVCTGADARLAGAWDDERRATLHAAFDASGAPYRARTWETVAATLDDHAGRIVAAQQEACEATRVRGEHSEAVLDARSRCIGLRVRELAALVDELSRTNADVMARATGAAQALGSPEACLTAVTETEEDARPEVQADRERLAEASARRWAGRYSPALDEAREVSEDAVALGADALRAEALTLEGALDQELGDRAAAEAALEQATVTARTSQRPLLEAAAWIALVRIVEPDQGGASLASFRSRLARASLEAAGGDRGREADLERNLGTALVAAGDYEAALEHQRRARELFEAERGADSLAVANTDDSIGSVLHALGRHAEALEYHRRAAEILERLLGPSHPYVGTALANVASELTCEGELQAALQPYERAVAIVETSLGPDHVKVAAISSNFAVLLRKLGRTDDALARYQQAAEILSRHLGADHPDVLRVMANVADLRIERGELSIAEDIYRRTLAGLSARLGPGHADVGIAHMNLAFVLDREDRDDEAVPEVDAAVAVLEAALGEDHPIVARALQLQGELHSRHGPGAYPTGG